MCQGSKNCTGHSWLNIAEAFHFWDRACLLDYTNRMFATTWNFFTQDGRPGQPQRKTAWTKCNREQWGWSQAAGQQSNRKPIRVGSHHYGRKIPSGWHAHGAPRYCTDTVGWTRKFGWSVGGAVQATRSGADMLRFEKERTVGCPETVFLPECDKWLQQNPADIRSRTSAEAWKPHTEGYERERG